MKIKRRVDLETSQDISLDSPRKESSQIYPSINYNFKDKINDLKTVIENSSSICIAIKKLFEEKLRIILRHESELEGITAKDASNEKPLFPRIAEYFSMKRLTYEDLYQLIKKLVELSEEYKDSITMICKKVADNKNSSFFAQITKNDKLKILEFMRSMKISELSTRALIVQLFASHLFKEFQG